MTRRADDFSWSAHRKHRSFEQLHRPNQFLPAGLTLQNLKETIEHARKDAIEDLRLCGVDCSWTAAGRAAAAAAVPEETPDDNGFDDSLDDSDVDGWLDAAHVSNRDPRVPATHSGQDSDDQSDDTDVEDNEGDLTDEEEQEETAPPPSPAATLVEPWSTRHSSIQKCNSATTIRDKSGAEIHKQCACAFVSRHTKLPNSRARFRAPKNTPSPMLP
jgi:hypothetical protein